MGLQGYYSTPDQAYAAAYMHINTVRVHKNEAYIFIAVYADKAARDAYQDPIFTSEYVAAFSILDNGLYPNTYSYLKTQSPFTGWIDVFEPAPSLAQVIPFPVPDPVVSDSNDPPMSDPVESAPNPDPDLTPDPAPADPVDPNAGA